MINIQKKYLIPLILEFFLIFPAISKIVVSIKPVGFIVAAITDSMLPIEVLLPYGASEHDYFLKPSDLKKIKDSELLIWIAPEIEKFLIKPSLFLAKNSLILSSIAEVQKLIIYSENKKRFHKNMHLWLSPEIVKYFAFAIYKKLSILFPQKKEKFYVNLISFEEQLEITNTKIRKQFKMIKDKKYLVFHDAFSYFEKYYGLLPIGFLTINPLIPPGIKGLTLIKKQIATNKISCIFSEPQYKNYFIKELHNNSIKQGILDPLGTNIPIKKDSYLIFLRQLSDQYITCLK